LQRKTENRPVRVDHSFDPGGGADDVVLAVAVRNGKIVVGGRFGSINGESHIGVARLNRDGSVDPTFNGRGVCNSVGVSSDDKIVIGGVGGLVHHGILRLLPTGEVDESFAISVDRPLGQVYALTILPDDETVFAGSFMRVNDEPRFRIARANADGTLDPMFLPEGGSIFEVYAVAVRGNGKIYQGGYIVSRIGTDGLIDESFAWSQFNGTSEWVGTVAIQDDDKPIIGGSFTTVEDFETGQGMNRNYVARLNNDGTLDESFGAGQSLADNIVEAVAIQPDSRILIAGSFTTVNGVPRSRIARLLGDAPVLSMQTGSHNDVTLSWPAAYTNWVLQAAKEFKPDKWKTVHKPPTLSNGINSVNQPIGGRQRRFYRLVQE
jgi:uncharacterized delta-60 repeat protein